MVSTEEGEEGEAEGGDWEQGEGGSAWMQASARPTGAAAPACALNIGHTALVLLSADSAALGLWERGSLVTHKVLTGYTVRRKQGAAQAVHEQRGGGGGTAGSALRRRETRRLFQAAASRLAAWAPQLAACHALFASGSVGVWDQLYAAR